MTDNDQATDADRYRALSDDAYAAADRATDPESQLIMRQIPLSCHRLSLIADERHLVVAAQALGQPSVEAGTA